MFAHLVFTSESGGRVAGRKGSADMLWEPVDRISKTACVHSHCVQTHLTFGLTCFGPAWSRGTDLKSEELQVN